MAQILIRHKVADYGRWKPQFDAHGATRKAAGSTGSHLFRNPDEPNDVAIVFDWDSVENAQRFAASDDLRQVMTQAGVLGKPDIYLLDESG